MRQLITALMLWAAVAVGQVMDFDGADQYVGMSHSSKLSPTSEMSISMWAYMRPDTGNSVLLSKWGDLTTERAYVVYTYNYIGGNGRDLTFEIHQSDGTVVRTSSEDWWIYSSPSGTLADGWHYITANANGTQISLFVDGVLTSSTTYDGTINSTTSDLRMGVLRPEDAIYDYDGQLDDIRIYSTALTSNQIARLTLDTCEMYEPTLWTNAALHAAAETWDTGYAPVMTDLGLTLDRSGNGNDGDVTGDVLESERGGWFGNFDGSSEHIETETNPTGDITFSLWMNSDDLSSEQYSISQRNTAGTTYHRAIGVYLGNISMYSRTSGGSARVASTTQSVGWHHVMGTQEGNVIKIYYDGEAKATNDMGSAYSQFNKIDIGRNGTANTRYDGSVANAAIYSVALTAENAATLYAAGRHAPRDAISTANLVGFWDMRPATTNHLAGAWRGDRTGTGNGNSFTNLPDLSGNGNDGVIYNSPTIEAAR